MTARERKWPLKLLALASRAYPSEFRERFGEELHATNRERIDGVGGLRLFTVVVRLSAITVRDGLAERFQARVSTSGYAKRGTMKSSNGVGHDVNAAFKSVRRAPGFSLAIIALLGVTTGATTAVFSVVSSIVFNDLPFPNAKRIEVLCETHPEKQGFCSNSFVNAEDWNNRSHSYEAVSAARGWSHIMRTDRGSRSISVGIADTRIFDVFNFTTVTGRTLLHDDAGRRVAVLTYESWQSLFGGDPEITNQSVVLDGEPYAIVGVLAPGSVVPGITRATMWLPIPFDQADPSNRDWRGFRTFGLLAPGVDPASAHRELASIAAQLRSEFPETNTDWGITTRPLRSWVVGDARATLLAFLGAVGLVLLVGCVNVANIILTRTGKRSREIAVRAAIGGGPGRIARLLLIENLWLGLGGAAIGWFVALAGVRTFVALAPPSIPRLDEVAIDWPVALFLAAIAVASSLSVGLVPALTSRKVNTAVALRREGRTATSGRFAGRARLIAAEVALSVMLLIGATLLMRTFVKFSEWSPGFSTEGVVTTWVLASTEKYASGAEVSEMLLRATDEVRSLPGVTEAGAGSAGPLFGGGDGTTGAVADGTGGQSPVQVSWYDIGPGFMETLGVSLLAGRYIARSDTRNTTPVAMLNRTAAEALFGSVNVVGRTVRLPEREQAVEVIGVLENVQPVTPGARTQPEIYWPNLQQPRYAAYLAFRISNPDVPAPVDAVRSVLAGVDPDLGVSSFHTMASMFGSRLTRPRFNAMLIATFAGVAVLLACVGIAAVISFNVASRTREIGVRKSLGATEGSIAKLIARQASVPVGAGLLIGVAGAAALSRFLAGMIYGVSATDPATYAAAAAGFAIVAGMACFGPARKASRIDPTVAMRAE